MYSCSQFLSVHICSQFLSVYICSQFLSVYIYSRFLSVYIHHGNKYLEEDVDDRIKDSLQGIVRQLEGKYVAFFSICITPLMGVGVHLAVTLQVNIDVLTFLHFGLISL
ncbi:hypothetical protein DPMN_083256 [Dreissena polymorpha]|uniref:Uncharacterized protein n=1 Tax=Dreissena polymorpha TaxID=45954 RepID=A0A9D4BI30_DREPO|nr:hypothetical protein DPMN_083256 [Dreissena polymorpha]